MKSRKLIATVFIIISLVLGVLFFMKVVYPETIQDYFNKAYYGQFGPITICVELFIGGYYLLIGHKKSNFALALFAFTALSDIIFNVSGLFISTVPLYGMLLFFGCAVFALWIAFSNAFKLGRITLLGALVSFILGNIVEFFFNYF